MTINDSDLIKDAVRARYAAAATTAASCCGPTSCGPGDTTLEVGDVFGASQYGDDERGELPETAVLASLGCGNPTALAELHPGEVVLDLGSGGGIDVLLSARRVGPTGKAYGLDMTEEMLALAETNKAEAGVTNAEFVLGSIEEVPLPDDHVDVIISNCVVNLSPDKEAVFRESFRVLAPGGRLAISDIVLSRPLPDELGSLMALWTGCIAGALTEEQVVEGLREAGFEDVSVEPVNIFARAELEGLAAGLSPADIPDGLDLEQAIGAVDGVIRSAFIRATKPGIPRSKEAHTPAIHVYEPALCCNTGVCGPDVDQALVEFTADLDHLAARGADIFRHNLANDPSAFAEDDAVRAFLQVAGSEGLPLTTVDGVTVMTGRYPTRAQLLKFADLADDAVPAGAALLTMADDSSAESSCGCGPSGCC